MNTAVALRNSHGSPEELTSRLKLRHFIDVRPSNGRRNRRGRSDRWSETGRCRRRAYRLSVTRRRYISADGYVVMIGRPTYTTVKFHVLVDVPFRRPSGRHRIAVAIDRHYRRRSGMVIRRSVNGGGRVPPVWIGRHHLADPVVERRHATLAAAEVGGRWKVSCAARRRHV